MTRRYTDIAFTDSVKAAQTRYGTRRNAQKLKAGTSTTVTIHNAKWSSSPSGTASTWRAWDRMVGPTSSSGEGHGDFLKC